jgi:adenylate cyclase
MAKDRLSGKLVVILHADVAGSTALVQQDEQLTHERIQGTFHRLGDTITTYHGHVRELRGDALLAEFDRASDAVTAALAFQTEQVDSNKKLNDHIQPTVRVGIAMGEVIIADDTITGTGVVLAQRLEQMSDPCGVVIQGAAYETIPGRFPFEYENLGEQALKGFDQPIRAFAVRQQPGKELPLPEVIATPQSAEPEGLKIPDKPSIAVLAFDNLSGDPGQEYLSDGISESIITGLSRFTGLFVIARQSSFSYKGKATRVQEIASNLGVQYILEGSVQRSNNRVRVIAQLIDAMTGHHLWVQKYDRQWEGIFALQDDITQHIISNIGSFEGPLEKATRVQVKQKAPSSLRAYDYLLLGRERFFLVTKEGNAKARELFQKSVELDPSYSLGHTWIAWTHLVDRDFGWSDAPAASLNLGLDHAQKAVALDSTEAEAHWVLGMGLTNTKNQQKIAIAEFERALSLSPNNADLLASYGWALSYMGKAEEAVELIKKAMRLNPVYPDWYIQGLIIALYCARCYEEVIAVSKTINVRHLTTHLVLAGSYAQMGQLKDAKTPAADALEENPDFSLRQWSENLSFENPVDLEHYIDGLRKAGFPE